VCERGKRENFETIVERFGLIEGRFANSTNKERFVTRHGRRRA
jgi:hypothetical protein